MFSRFDTIHACDRQTDEQPSDLVVSYKKCPRNFTVIIYEALFFSTMRELTTTADIQR